MFNPLEFPIAYTKPLRTPPSASLGDSAWHGHIPFAFTIMQLHRPHLFVELGTHTGNSYCAFCQAIEMLALPCRAYAVDTWEGDEHSGSYGSEVFDEIQQYHDDHYSGFSILLKMRFGEAVNFFSNESIDLLHIDGCHSYQAVSSDFEMWLPKLSSRGVVLLHDTAVRDKGFGVWKLFEELSEKYPVFEFVHGHGLGVVGVGADVQQEPVADILGLTKQEEVGVRRHFSALGNGLLKGVHLQQRDARIANFFQSRSWRMTAPMRWAGRRMAAIRNHIRRLR